MEKVFLHELELKIRGETQDSGVAAGEHPQATSSHPQATSCGLVTFQEILSSGIAPRMDLGMLAVQMTGSLQALWHCAVCRGRATQDSGVR